MHFRASLVVLLALSLTMNGEKPYDFKSAPGKLPKEIVPLEYQIRIVPEISKLTFTGSETIKIKTHVPATELVLNAAELNIIGSSIDGQKLTASAVKLDANAELLTITLPKELSARDHVLALEFNGKINESGRGLYYMPYQEQG